MSSSDSYQSVAAWNVRASVIANGMPRILRSSARPVANGREANPEKVRKWAQADPEKNRAKSRKWAQANLEKARENGRKWHAENPEKSRAIDRNRRARKKNAEGSHTAGDIESIRERQHDQCNVCGLLLWGRGHVDHIVPLSRGGSNWPSNLQLLCAPCNISKHARDPFDWILEQSERGRVACALDRGARDRV